jgi:hypothetical protein
LNTTAVEGGTYWCSATAFNASTPKSNTNHFFHDNGPTKSIVNDRALFRSYNQFDTAVNVNGFDSGLSAPAPAGGIVRLESIVNGHKFILDISDALDVPTARVNLISGSALDQKGVTTITYNGKIELSKNGQVIAQGITFIIWWEPNPPMITRTPPSIEMVFSMNTCHQRVFNILLQCRIPFIYIPVTVNFTTSILTIL